MIRKSILGWIFAFIAFFSVLSSVGIGVNNVFAEPGEGGEANTAVEIATEQEGGNAETVNSNSSENNGDTAESGNSGEVKRIDDRKCKESMGAVGWLVCPATGVVAQAVDFLYGLLEQILVIQPIKVQDGTPIYEIWKYCRDITNIAFIIFLLTVIYSQITGLGITNYGIKKALPKLIVSAILINLSFIICSLLVDASNIVGGGVRDLFGTVAETAISDGITTGGGSGGDMVGLFGAIAGGTALTVGGIAVAVQSGAIFMLIPTVLGGLVAILAGVITIAIRQAVVALLVMVAPLAIVANIMPNTESWFKKWKSLFKTMLVFYPMFSLLFGAANLAGFAIVASARDVFGVLLGVAVQIFPLFFSWSLMRSSGTFLDNINNRLRSFADRPLATNRAWAQSRAQVKRQNTLLYGNKYMPYTALARFLEERKVEREKEISDNAEILKNRGFARYAGSHYRRDGTVSRKGERAYARQAENARLQEAISRDEHNFDQGLGGRGRDAAQTARLKRLDAENVNAFDDLRTEMSRGEWIKYENDKGYYERIEAAQRAHADDMYGYDVDPDTGTKTPKRGYDFSKLPIGSKEQREAMSRYNTMQRIMEGDEFAVDYAAAVAAHGYSTEANAIGSKFLTYYNMVPASKDLANRLTELTMRKDAAEYIDAILPGLRILNERGDVDIVLGQLKNMMLHDDNHDGLKLGTHASQAIGNFLMFEVKDKDAWLRRFGKYINLETARMYNSSDPRKLEYVDYSEYVRGYHYEPDPNSPDGKRIMLAKKGMRELMEGTPLDGLERAAFDSYDESVREAYTTTDADGNKHLDVAAYLKKKEEIENAIGAAFVSSSLKYMSGSEQLLGAVKMKAGYVSKQDPVTGKQYIVPMWEDAETMAAYGMTGHEDELQEFYRRRTLQYIADQSPNQILGLRSDYKEPLMKHLYDAYVESDGAGWSDEELRERDGYVEQMRALESEYSGMPDGAEKDALEGQIANLKQKMVGAQFRQILNSKGKLEQIYNTRRSGAANNAKDWVRDWLNLDSPEEMQKVFERNRRARQNRGATSGRQAQNTDTNGYVPFGTYGESHISDFSNNLERIQHNMQGAPIEEIYDAMVEAAENDFGGVAGNAISDFEQYYADHQDTVNQHELAEKLIELMRRDLLG